MTAITTTIFPDAESWLSEHFEDLLSNLDNVCNVRPTRRPSKELFVYVYKDFSDEKPDDYPAMMPRDMNAHVQALQKLCDLISCKQLFVGGLSSAVDLLDPCNWDVEVTDAFCQLVAYREVIYG